jgi:hypothetical protein
LLDRPNRWQPHQQDRCAAGHYLPIPKSSQVFKKSTRKQKLPDDEPMHANKDTNRGIERLNILPEGEACSAEQRDG